MLSVPASAHVVDGVERPDVTAENCDQYDACEGGSTNAVSTSSEGGYSIPSSIVECESGGDPNALNASSGAGGLYQIIPSTWAAYGGTGSPHTAPVSEQHEVAARIYAAEGSSPWECAG